MTLKQGQTTTIAALLLALFLSFAAGRAFFYHTHLGAHGAMVVHSHLFGHSTHSHDEHAMEGIDFMIHAAMDSTSDIPEVTKAHVHATKLGCPALRALIEYRPVEVGRLRAPPAAA